MMTQIGFIGLPKVETREERQANFRKVAECGFSMIECGAGQTRDDAIPLTRSEIEDAGLRALSLHTTKYKIPEMGKQESFAEAVSLGCKNVIIAWGPVESREQLEEDAKLYNEFGKIANDHGIDLLYHNHNHEYQLIDGVYAWDILLETADPESLKIQLDVGWIEFGGASAVAALGKYGERIKCLHLRDLPKDLTKQGPGDDDRKDAPFAEVGRGSLDYVEVLKAAKKSGAPDLVIEQPKPFELEFWEGIKFSRDHIAAKCEEIGYSA